MQPPPGEHGDHQHASETARLLRAYHERDDVAARQRLIELYLPLVESFARRYTRLGVDYDDLYQVGCVGLINAIDRFELERGGELVAFAAPTIAGEIRRHLRDRGGSVRLPRRILELRAGARAAQQELSARLGRSATTTEIARHLDADEDDVALALDADRATSALELAPERDAGGDAMDAADDRLFLSDALRDLDERERRIIYLRYVRDLEPDDIARELNISRRQLSRNTQAALARLRLGLERSGPSPKVARRDEPPPGSPPAEPVAQADAAARSGRLLVRIPQSLHAELARAAARDQRSINRFVVTALATRTATGRRAHRRPAPSALAYVAMLAFAATLLVVVVVLAAGRVT